MRQFLLSFIFLSGYALAVPEKGMFGEFTGIGESNQSDGKTDDQVERYRIDVSVEKDGDFIYIVHNWHRPEGGIWKRNGQWKMEKNGFFTQFTNLGKWGKGYCLNNFCHWDTRGQKVEREDYPYTFMECSLWFDDEGLSESCSKERTDGVTEQWRHYLKRK